MKEIQAFLDNINVYDCGYEKIRIGNKSDGGYILLNDICENTDTLISIGIENDVSFDIDFTKKYNKTKINLYDNTITTLPVSHPNFNFFKLNVGNKNTNTTITLDKITKDLNNKTLLKMDIEWDEWKIFEKINTDTLLKFNQMVIEFHIIHIDINNFFTSNNILTPYFNNFYTEVYNKLNQNLFTKYKKILKKICKHFYIFHIHANNSLPKLSVNNNSFIPLLELSFVRKDLINTVKKTKCTYPIYNLDFPNKHYKPDISLDFINKT
jgi:hypothetical protein|tara:strand:+ start:751 stop:1551 length:801 start_codon:yes stop_codon:yes gene_type:complete